MCCIRHLPSREPFLCYRSRTPLEKADDIRQKEAPSVVRHIFGEVARAFANGERLHGFVVKRTNVMGLAVVIPY